MKRLLRVLGIAGLLVGVLAYPAACALDAASGQVLLVVEAQDAASVDVNRGLWELDGSKKEGVPGIYGPSHGVARVVLVPEEKILHPKEDPSLAIYLKAAGDHPIQAQTLYFFGIRAAIGGILAGAGLLFVASRMKKPEAPAPGA